MLELVIGGVIGIVGTLGGSVITAYFSHKSAKLQVDANYTNQQLQIESQAKEARRGRLIEVRKVYLVPLRQTISNWVQSAVQEANMIVRREIAGRKGEFDPDNSALKLKEAMDASKEWTSQVTCLRGQISDKTLSNLIDKVITITSEVNLSRMPLLKISNDAKDEDIDTLNTAFGELKRLLNILNTHLLKVNKQIEGLLTGDESQ